MFQRVSIKLTDKLISLKTINSKDREIYEFGIQHIFITLLNISTVVVIGFILHSTKEALAFILAFIPLRIFAGGFHFSTPIRCYVFSSCFVTAVILAMRHYSITFLIYCLLYCMASIIILIFAPVEDKNKPLDQMEKKIYRKRTITVLLLESVLIFIFYFTKILFAAQCIMVSTIVLSLMIVLGVIKNSITDME